MPSFDVVSKVDKQEVDNAFQQTRKELTQRYDFKGTDTTVEHNEEGIVLRSSTEDRLKAAYEVLVERGIKRKISPLLTRAFGQRVGKQLESAGACGSCDSCKACATPAERGRISLPPK